MSEFHCDELPLVVSIVSGHGWHNTKGENSRCRSIFVVVCEGNVWLCAGGEVVVVAGTKRGWDLLQGDTHSQLLALKQGGLPSLCQVGAALTIPPPPARVIIC